MEVEEFEKYFREAKRKVLEELEQGTYTSEVSGIVPRLLRYDREPLGKYERHRRTMEALEKADWRDLAAPTRPDFMEYTLLEAETLAPILTVASILGHEDFTVIYAAALNFLGVPLLEAVRIGEALAYATTGVGALLTLDGIRRWRKWIKRWRAKRSIERNL